MTTAEFIRTFAAEWQVTVADAEVWIRPIFECIGEQLLKNEELKLSHIGTFRHICTAPRAGRNMNTGARVDIPSRMQLEYRPTDSLDNAMRALPINLELTKASAERRKKEKKVPRRASLDAEISTPELDQEPEE